MNRDAISMLIGPQPLLTLEKMGGGNGKNSLKQRCDFISNSSLNQSIRQPLCAPKGTFGEGSAGWGGYKNGSSQQSQHRMLRV
jgi:hypothetical protein